MWMSLGLGCALALAGGDAAVQTDAPEDAPVDDAIDIDAMVSEARAEYQRLHDEIERLATRNAWSGVERHFEEIRATGVTLTFEDWMRGAHAARALGNIQDSKDRLLKAKEVREDPEVFNWLYEIDSHYAEVFLACDADSHILLEAASMPFDPVQRRAVEYAQGEILEQCRFEGLLPHGSYAFFGKELEVSAAQAVRRDLRGLEIDRKRRKELDKAWKEAREARSSGS